MRATVVLSVAALALSACQFAGGPRGSATEAATGVGAPVGAPAAGMPKTLPELLERGQLVAREWQDAPVLVEVEVDVDDETQWAAARLTYLAAEADRFLSLVTAGSGFRQERPTLSTFQLQPVTEEGLEALPPFPDDAQEPAALAAGEVAGECGVEGSATVFYVTGAPVSWDGTQWTSPPRWQATVTDGEAPGAQLDPVTGAGGCLPGDD